MDGRGLRWATSDATISVRRVTDSNPVSVGSLGAGNPTDAATLHSQVRLHKSFGPGGVSSSPLLLLYGFRRLALLFLFQKIIWARPSSRLPLVVQAFVFEEEQCSCDHIKRKRWRCSATL